MERKMTEMYSLSESVAKKAIKKTPHEFLNFNMDHLSRIYPTATRINSSNFNPAYYWMYGCQMVALNYQTNGMRNYMSSGSSMTCMHVGVLYRHSNAAEYGNVQSEWRLWLCP